MAKVVVIASGVPRYQTLGSDAYNEVFAVGATITAGTSITLPDSGTYVGSELSVFLNGQRLNYLEDYSYVGSPPRTQVQITFDLVAGDLLTFRKEL